MCCLTNSSDEALHRQDWLKNSTGEFKALAMAG